MMPLSCAMLPLSLQPSGNITQLWVFQLSHIIGQIIAFDKRLILVNALVLSNFCKYTIPLLKTRFLALHFVADSVGLFSKTFM